MIPEQRWSLEPNSHVFVSAILKAARPGERNVEKMLNDVLIALYLTGYTLVPPSAV